MTAGGEGRWKKGWIIESEKGQSGGPTAATAVAAE